MFLKEFCIHSVFCVQRILMLKKFVFKDVSWSSVELFRGPNQEKELSYWSCGLNKGGASVRSVVTSASGEVCPGQRRPESSVHSLMFSFHGERGGSTLCKEFRSKVCT